MLLTDTLIVPITRNIEVESNFFCYVSLSSTMTLTWFFFTFHFEVIQEWQYCWPFSFIMFVFFLIFLLYVFAVFVYLLPRYLLNACNPKLWFHAWHVSYDIDIHVKGIAFTIWVPRCKTMIKLVSSFCSNAFICEFHSFSSIQNQFHINAMPREAQCQERRIVGSYRAITGVQPDSQLVSSPSTQARASQGLT